MSHGAFHAWNGLTWGGEAGAGTNPQSTHTHPHPHTAALVGSAVGQVLMRFYPALKWLQGFYSRVTEIHFQQSLFQVSLECTTRELKIVNGSRVIGHFLSHTRASLVWLLVHSTGYFLDSGAEAWLMCCEQNHADLSQLSHWVGERSISVIVIKFQFRCSLIILRIICQGKHFKSYNIF